jgi:hypothetical protein
MREKLRLKGLTETELGPKLMPFQVTHTTDLKVYFEQRRWVVKITLNLSLIRATRRLSGSC